MANFRTERVYLRVEDPLERFDPNAGIVAEDLADAVLNDPGESDNGSLSDFLLTPFDRPRWFASSAGAQAVHRRLEAVRQELLGPLTEIQRSGRERQQRALEGALERLAELRAAGRRFCFVARDLRPSKSPQDPARATPQVVAANLPQADDILRSLDFKWEQQQQAWRALVPDAGVRPFAVVVPKPPKYRKKTPPWEQLGGLNESLRWLRGSVKELNHRIAEALLPIWLREFRTAERSVATADEIEAALVLARVEWVFDRLLVLHFGGDLFANSLIRTPVAMNGQLLGEPLIRPD